jgi:hypothetical protein
MRSPMLINFISVLPDCDRINMPAAAKKPTRQTSELNKFQLTPAKLTMNECFF